MSSFATRPQLLSVVLALVGGMLALTSSTHANADSRTFADSTADRGGLDIHRVGVINEQRLTVRIVVDDLQRRAGQGSVSVWLDTAPARSGPEYFIGSGLWESDWQIWRTRGWQVSSSMPLPCPIDQRLLFDRDTIVFTTGKGCLGRYGKVRVSVTTRGGGVSDHSPARHVFHAWVRRF
jgi:hypothetical protein